MLLSPRRGSDGSRPLCYNMGPGMCSAWCRTDTCALCEFSGACGCDSGRVDERDRSTDSEICTRRTIAELHPNSLEQDFDNNQQQIL